MVCGILLVLGDAVVRGRLCSSRRRQWVMRWRILAPLGFFLRATVTDDGVDEETEEGEAGICQYCTQSRQTLNVQYEDAESNSYSAGALAYGDKVHDQDASPESSLEAVHGQESAWLQLVAKEHDDRKNVDEEHNDDEEHEDND
jgi:hypothetical protein